MKLPQGCHDVQTTPCSSNTTIQFTSLLMLFAFVLALISELLLHSQTHRPRMPRAVAKAYSTVLATTPPRVTLPADAAAAAVELEPRAYAQVVIQLVNAGSLH